MRSPKPSGPTPETVNGLNDFMARPPKYPWRTLEVGGYFMIRGVAQAGNAVAQANKWNSPKRFSVKTRKNLVTGEKYFQVKRDV